MSKNDNEKKRGSTSTPKNPQKKQKNDESEMKAKRQINFKAKDQSSNSPMTDQSQCPVSITKLYRFSKTPEPIFQNTRASKTNRASMDSNTSRLDSFNTMSSSSSRANDSNVAISSGIATILSSINNYRFRRR